jgi:hypothetical protein
MTDIHTPRGVRTLYLTLALLSGALVLSLSAGASNTTLRASLDKWSRTIGADAHSISLAATRRHPRRMTYSSVRFRRDALRARAAIAAQHPSNAKGQKARKLALTAFADYAAAGSRWAASGRARLAKQRTLAGRNAAAAATFARAGNGLLLVASRLVR